MIERHGLAMALVLLAGGGGAPPSWTGTWTWGGDAKVAGGTLAVRDDEEGTRFQLQISRGLPTGNMGFLEGRLTVEDGRATYRSPDGTCAIAFAFARGAVVLKTIGDDAGCSFGNQVHADGTYRRVSRKVPEFDLIPE
jgi:hypothetical protein